MLELLINYARTHLPSAPEPGFAAKDVRWVINCDAQGNFLDVIELGDTTQKKNKGQLFVKCPALSLGEKKSEGVTLKVMNGNSWYTAWIHSLKLPCSLMILRPSTFLNCALKPAG